MSPIWNLERALKSITIQEIPLGKTLPEKPPTRMKIIEIDDNMAQGDTKNNSNAIQDKLEKESKVIGEGDMKVGSPESKKLITDAVSTEKGNLNHDIVPPVNSVQFMAEWKYLKDASGARSDYLSIIEPSKIPSIFDNALESDVLSEILQILAEDMGKFGKKTITAYLKGLCRVKRFSALAMFLSANDKQLLNKLLDHCRTVEKCSDADIADLKNKFEL